MIPFVDVVYDGDDYEFEISLEPKDLLQGKTIVVNFDEQIVYNQLDQNENALWSLLLASGYLKVEEVDYRGITREPWYTLKRLRILRH